VIRILAIIDDLANAVGVDRFVDYVDVDPTDLPDGLVHKLYAAGVTDAATLIAWVNETLGRAVVIEVLRYLKLEFSRNDSIEDLCEKWFSYRGVGEFLRPRAQPDTLADVILEMAQQAASTPGSLDAARLIAGPLATLLRFTSLFYGFELRATGRPPFLSTSDTETTVADVLADLSLDELCRLLNCATPIKAQPYDPRGTATISLAGGAADASLRRIAELAGAASGLSADQSRDFAQSVLALLAEWRGDEPFTPKACAVAEIRDQGMWRFVSCRDESGATVTVTGAKAVLDHGDAVLVRARDEGRLWAPLVQAIPAGAVWETPETASRAGKRERTRRMRKRDQVFISYSHDDEKWLRSLKQHLQPYSRNAKLEVWDDTRIKAGQLWRDSIKDALAATRVAVLLVTPAFLASDFIAGHELPPLLDAARDEGARIVWIPVRSSSYQITPIEAYQAAHSPNRPLASLSEAELDEALVRISAMIHEYYQH
jgi:hypothetical protein